MTATETALHARDAIRIIVEGGTLTEQQATEVMDGIMRGEVTPAQIASLLTALRMRGETAEEITGFARALRRHVQTVEAPGDLPLVDTCGTGGDSSGTFNISTTAALVIAGAGVRVAKHGNRSVTSHCGSADVLEALGVAIELPPDRVAASIREAGIGFMFAPAYHPGFRHAGPTRREIGVRTAFNLLGPMTNPAGTRRQIIGVSVPSAARLLAEALARLESDRVLIVYSPEGLDELGLGAESYVVEYDRAAGSLREYAIGPESVGLGRAGVDELAGGDATANAAMTRGVLEGQPGPRRDVVLFNAGAGLYASGAAADIREGVALAREAIESGRALDALDRFIAVTQRLAQEETKA
jgi:anthranilate phosphoribosyltransferase